MKEAWGAGMRNIWFISDTHFGHENIIYYAHRPFEGPEDMDEIMIDKWNTHVKPEDLVYHLGDFAMNSNHAKKIRPLLNGTIRLIAGNHDDIPKYAHAGLFQRITESRNLETVHSDLKGVYATHRPIILGETARINVHGHIHHRDPDSDHHINLSVEKTGYAPVHLEDLVKMVKGAR